MRFAVIVGGFAASALACAAHAQEVNCRSHYGQTLENYRLSTSMWRAATNSGSPRQVCWYAPLYARNIDAVQALARTLPQQCIKSSAPHFLKQIAAERAVAMKRYRAACPLLPKDERDNIESVRPRDAPTR